MAVFILVLAGGRAQAGQCKDQWVTNAITQVTGNSPADSGQSGVCNIYNFNGGRWNSYNELVNYVQTYYSTPGHCLDTFVTNAVTQVTGRAPVDSWRNGACNTSNYHNGQWGSYNELVGYVQAYFNSRSSYGLVNPSGTGSLLNGVRGPGIVGANGIVSTNGNSLVAQGGGNATARGNSLVAQGGGNATASRGNSLVAQGGGN